MVKSRISLGLIVLALLGAACGGTTTINSNLITGSGVVKTETRDVTGAFTAVEMRGSAELIVTVGDTNALTVEAEDNLLPLLTNTISDGKLILATKPNSSYSATRPVIFRLTVTNLESLAALDATTVKLDSLDTASFDLTVGGSATVTLGTLAASDRFELRATNAGTLTADLVNSPALTVNADNSASVNIRSLTAATITATLDGSASVSLSGTATTQDVTTRSSSAYNAQTLNSQAVTANASGSSSVTVSVSGLLNAAAASSATITYFGSPEVQRQTSESGTIQPG